MPRKRARGGSARVVRDLSPRSSCIHSGRALWSSLSSPSEGRCNLHFPRTSGARDIRTSFKAACVTLAIERATSHVAFREFFLYILLLLCLSPDAAGSILYLKGRSRFAGAQMFMQSAPRFRIAELILNYLLVNGLFHFRSTTWIVLLWKEIRNVT